MVSWKQIKFLKHELIHVWRRGKVEGQWLEVCILDRLKKKKKPGIKYFDSNP